MGIWDDIGRGALAVGTFGGSEIARAGINALSPQPFSPSGAAQPAPYQRSPLFDAAQKTLEGYSGPAKINYQPRSFSGPLAEFAGVRDQTTQRLNAQSGAQSDALQRRFASMGNLNSGAYVKAQQLQDQQAQETMAGAQTNIGLQEAQTRRGLEEAERGREFSANATDTGAQNQFNQFKLGSQVQLAGQDQAAQNQAFQQANDQFNKEMQMYQAKHSGGLLGAGGFMGTGIGA